MGCQACFSALDFAADGTEIVVDDVSLPVRKAVIVTKGVTIRSRSGDPAKAAIGRYSASSNYRILEINHPRAVISGLAIENGYINSYFDIGGCARINKEGGTVTNCIIRNGYFSGQGGGGGGISIWAGLLTHCFVTNNSTSGVDSKGRTGAVLLEGGKADSCLIAHNTSTMTKSTNYDVAGVAVQGGQIRNSTIVGNRARTCGGVWIRSAGTSRVINCLIAGNTSSTQPAPANDFTAENATCYGYFQYCAMPAAISGGGTGCVHGDLPFKNAAKGDYTPTSRSVAIGNGLVENWMAAGLDLAGNPRLGHDRKVDIGCLENQAAARTVLSVE